MQSKVTHREMARKEKSTAHCAGQFRDARFSSRKVRWRNIHVHVIMRKGVGVMRPHASVVIPWCERFRAIRKVVAWPRCSSRAHMSTAFFSSPRVYRGKQSNNAEEATRRLRTARLTPREIERGSRERGTRKLVALGPLSMLRDWFTTT